MHPSAQKDHKNLTELKWQLDALQIHAKLQPTEVDAENNLLKELEKDYGMFDDNKKLHMRNINDTLTLHDVVNFHEIITSQAKDPAFNISQANNLGIVGSNNDIFSKNQARRPLTAKAASNSTDRSKGFQNQQFKRQPNRQSSAKKRNKNDKY